MRLIAAADHCGRRHGQRRGDFRVQFDACCHAAATGQAERAAGRIGLDHAQSCRVDRRGDAGDGQIQRLSALNKAQGVAHLHLRELVGRQAHAHDGALAGGELIHRLAGRGGVAHLDQPLRHHRVLRCAQLGITELHLQRGDLIGQCLHRSASGVGGSARLIRLRLAHPAFSQHRVDACLLFGGIVGVGACGDALLRERPDIARDLPRVDAHQELPTLDRHPGARADEGHRALNLRRQRDGVGRFDGGHALQARGHGAVLDCAGLHRPRRGDSGRAGIGLMQTVKVQPQPARNQQDGDGQQVPGFALRFDGGGFV